ncbi:hypothetical protein, conserved [Babesia bigemina]|uniref:Uncharacterized protein n=1 Tax=Babesia bigemina TaxID=5866 RepID=A0A061D2G1_BABBI|nr:hypothetical protein, conserved [Babesia bigemina]CDR94277.1 hypothetical protein, conserved [Babesia bigemina]|eukprot:XP_012766463.1 hypothetical protein, conserved [Babesia bigemina]
MVGMLRSDGRSYLDLRPLVVELNPLRSGPSCRLTVAGSADGSGDEGEPTSVQAVIYFLADNRNRNTVGAYHRPTFEVYVRPPRGPVKGYIRGMECLLLKTLQNLVDVSSLGKVLVSVRIQVLSEGSGLLSMCLNALVTCAIISGLKLHEIPQAVQFGILLRNGSGGFIADPTPEELQKKCSVGVTILCSPQSGRIFLTTVDYGGGGYEDFLQERLEEAAKQLAKSRLIDINNKYREAFGPASVSFDANGS